MASEVANKEPSQGVGYALAVGQAVLYSTMGIVCKMMLGTGMTTGQIMMLRFSMTLVLLGVFLLVFTKQRLVSKNPLVWGMGFLFFFSAWLYYVGVDMLTAGMATVLYFVFPTVVAVLGIFVFKERLTPRLAIALALTMAGIFFISEVYLPGKATLNPVGICITIFACCCFALYTVGIQWIGQRSKPQLEGGRQDGSMTTTFTMSIVCMLISLVVFHDQIPSMFALNLQQVGMGVYMAVFNTILPLMLLSMAIGIVGATKTSLIGTSETPCSLLLAWLLLAEIPTGFQFAGAVLIVLGVVLVASGKADKPKPDAALQRATDGV